MSGMKFFLCNTNVAQKYHRQRKKDLLGLAMKAEEFGLIELDMKVGLMDMVYGDVGT